MVTTTPTTEFECGACHASFPTVAEVFSHPCTAVAALMRPGIAERPTNRADSIDAPERHEPSARPSAPAAKPVRSNRYAGKCLRCGAWVAAGEGLLVKNHAGGRGESWAVEHKVSECPAVGTPAQGSPVVAAPAPAGPTMSPAQEKFLRSLIAERQTAQRMDADETVAALNTLPNPKLGASAVVDGLLALPKRTAPVVDDNPTNDDMPVYAPEKGDVHVLDGVFYRVHLAQGSGRAYTVRWTGGEWVYAAGALRRCSTATLATAADAARFGELYHACVFCTRPLDTPESTEVGYGPVCAAKRGLPWGNG